MNDLPQNCIGIRLRYKANIEMEIIDCTISHIRCQFDDGSRIVFGRGSFTTKDIVSYPKKETIKEPTLF